MRKIYLIIILLLFGFFNLDAQYEDSKGKDFWLTFPPNYHNNKYADNANDSQRYGDSLYLFIVADVPTNGSIVYYNSTGREYTHNFSITNPAEVYTFKVSYYNFELVGFNDSGEDFKQNQCERVAKQSFHITSDNEIVVYAHSQAVTTSDAFMVFPTDILGNDYVIMSYYSDTDMEGTGKTPSQFAIVATEDSTFIQIDAYTPTYINGYGLQEITLNKGEVYLVQAGVYNYAYSDLTGTSVQSSKPIAVFSGHQRATVPIRYGHNNPSRDFLISQMPPVKTWGKNYFITPFTSPIVITQLGTDLYRILAAYDSTIIYINGLETTRLDKGEFYESSLVNAANITSNLPILVAQFKKTSQNHTGENNSSDPFFVVIPPKEQFMTSYKVMNTQAYQYYSYNSYTKVYTNHYITVVVPEAVRNQINLDGTNIASNLFTRISNSDYYFANIPVEEGQHSVSSPTEIGIIIYGYGYANSYGYVGGLSFKPHDFKSPEIISNIDCYELNGAITDTAMYDSGVISINVPDNEKINTEVLLSNFTQFQKIILFSAHLIDKYQDGKFKIKVVDSMKLESNKTIEIPGFTLKNELQQDGTIPFSSYIGKLNSEYCIDIPIKNYGKFEQTINAISLNYPDQFRIDNTLPLKIAAGQVENLRLCFLSEFDSTYVDSIIIANECIQRNVLNLKFGTQTDKNSPQITTNYGLCSEYSEVIFYDSLIYDYGLEKVEIEQLINCKADFEIIGSKEIKLKITVTDLMKDAIYALIATDSVGNTTKLTDTIQGFTLSSPLFEPNNNFINYQNCFIGNLYCDSIQFFNYGLKPIKINDVKIYHNIYFSIPQSQFPLIINPLENRILEVCYSPTNAKKQNYYDTLFISFNCIDFQINLNGDSKPILYEGVTNCNVPIKITSYGIPLKSYIGTVYPNPTNSSIKVDFGLAQNENIEINIFDIYGELVQKEIQNNYSAGIYSYLIDVENLPQGQYLIQLKLGSNLFYSKFMKFE